MLFTRQYFVLPVHDAHFVVTLFVQGSALASQTKDIIVIEQSNLGLKDLFPTLSQFVEGWLQLINSTPNPSLIVTRLGFCQQKTITLPIGNLEFTITKNKQKY